MNPIVMFLIYAAGVASSSWTDLPSWTPLVPAASALLWFFFRFRPGATFLLCLFIFSCGAALAALQLQPPRSAGHIRSFAAPGPVTVQGTIRQVNLRPAERSSLDISAELAGGRGLLAPVEGKVRLYLDGPADRFCPGDRVRFRARLRIPRTFGTPGEFDFPRHLAARDIYATAFLPDPEEVAVFASTNRSGLRSRLERTRVSIGKVIDSRAPPSSAPLVRALVIGDKGAVTREQRDLLSRGGVSHLFSISGLHLGLVAMFLLLPLRFLYCRSERLLLFSPPGRLLPLVILPLLTGYLMLSGNALPTRRAFLMFLAITLLLLGARRTPPLMLLATVALCLLFFEPLALFEPSFQLSFAGVLGLLILIPRWSPRLERTAGPLRWAALLMLATFAATVTTTPFVLFHFHLWGPSGLLANFIAVPAIGFGAVPLGLLGAILAPWCPAAAGPFFQACGWIIQGLLETVHRILHLPGMGGSILYLSPFATAALFACAGALLLPGLTPARRRMKALAGLSGLLLFFTPWPAPSGWTVTALSVGQGESILLRDPGGKHYLVDGGGSFSENFDPGERLVAPALGAMGVRDLEAVVLTHDHPDHLQGLMHILENFPTRAFWSAIPPSELPLGVQKILRDKEIRMVEFLQGWTSMNLSGNELRLYAPPRRGNENDRSLVLYARIGADGLLLTGDLEEEGVRRLLTDGIPGPVNLLKLPHHGSRRSAHELLLDTISPEIAFASMGVENPYGLPHPQVVEALQRRRIAFFRTDLDGTVRFTSEGNGWRSQRYRRGLFR